MVKLIVEHAVNGVFHLFHVKEFNMQVGVIATPDVHSFDLTERDHFIILGCDGLWGVSLFF